MALQGLTTVGWGSGGVDREGGGGGGHCGTLSPCSKNPEADHLTPFPVRLFSLWDGSIPQKPTVGGPKLGQLS